MSRFIPLTTLLLAAPALAFHALTPAESVHRARVELMAAEGLARAVHDAPFRAALVGHLDRAQQYLADAERAAPSPVGTLDATEAHRLLSAASFDSQRLAVLAVIAANGRFSVAEIEGLVGRLDFDDARVDALVLLYPATTEPYAYGRTARLLTFSSSRAEFHRRLGV